MADLAGRGSIHQARHASSPLSASERGRARGLLVYVGGLGVPCAADSVTPLRLGGYPRVPTKWVAGGGRGRGPLSGRVLAGIGARDAGTVLTSGTPPQPASIR